MLKPSFSTRRQTPGEIDELVECNYREFVEMYELGYYLLDTAFRNAVITATVRLRWEARGRFPGLPSIEAAWEHCPEGKNANCVSFPTLLTFAYLESGCTMKRLIVRYWALSRHVTETEVDKLPQSFATSMIKDMMDIRDGRVRGEYPTVETVYEYHEYISRNSKRT